MPRNRLLEMIKARLYDKKSNGVAHFLHIGEIVQSVLDSTQWKKGDEFGTIEELAKIFGVSRQTAKRAITPFLEKGILKTTRGKGVLVNEDYEEPPRMNLQANWNVHLQISDHSKAKILFNERVNACPWDTTGFASVPPLFQHMKRVHEKNGSTYGLIEAYFDAKLYDSCPQQFREDTILIAIEKLYPNLICSARQSIRIKRADSETAKYLKIPTGEPVAAITRTVADKDNRMVYLGKVIYPGERIEIQVELLIER